MSISKSYSRRPKNNNKVFLYIAVLAVIGGSIYALKKSWPSITGMFEPKIIREQSDTEANERLDRLMKDLGGDRAAILNLAKTRQERMDWVRTSETRLMVEWMLTYRLIELGEWDIAKQIFPALIPNLSVSYLDILAKECMLRREIDLLAKIERNIQEKSQSSNANVSLLLNSLERSYTIHEEINDRVAVIKLLSALEVPQMQARFIKLEDAIRAANLLMKKDELIGPNASAGAEQAAIILAKAKWPESLATSVVLLDQARKILNQDPAPSSASISEAIAQLSRCRVGLGKYAEGNYYLPECLALLGQAQILNQQYVESIKSLNQAEQLAETFSKSSPSATLQIVRSRAKANLALKNIKEAVRDLQVLTEIEAVPLARFQAMQMMASISQGDEALEAWKKCWEMLEAQPQIANSQKGLLAGIPDKLGDAYLERQDYPSAVAWYEKALPGMKQDYILSDGVLLTCEYKLAKALVEQKKYQAASKVYAEMITQMDTLSEEEMTGLNKAQPNIKKLVHRQLAICYIKLGRKDEAKAVVKLIGEALPYVAPTPRSRN